MLSKSQSNLNLMNLPEELQLLNKRKNEESYLQPFLIKSICNILNC